MKKVDNLIKEIWRTRIITLLNLSRDGYHSIVQDSLNQAQKEQPELYKELSTEVMSN